MENSQDKIQKICNELRVSTLEPAQKEAETIIIDAKARAQELIKDAEKASAELIESARIAIEQERNVFHSSLSQGVKQSLESLKQDIEEKLFNDQLIEVIKAKSADPQIIAKIIDCIVKAIDKEGLSADLSASIAKQIPARDVNELLSIDILQKLKNKSVSIGNFSGGAEVKLNDKGFSIDMSDEALRELLSRYVRKDFRNLIFKN